MTRADDYDDDAPEFDALEGTVGAGASIDSSANELSILVLQLVLGMEQMCILLEEAEEGEWKAISVRLRRMREAFARLPTGPQPKKRLGFAAPTAKPRKR